MFPNFSNPSIPGIISFDGFYTFPALGGSLGALATHYQMDPTILSDAIK